MEVKYTETEVCVLNNLQPISHDSNLSQDNKCKAYNNNYTAEQGNVPPEVQLKFEDGQRSNRVPYILNGQLYKIITRTGENVTVKCCNCPAERVYRGSVRSTGNFHMHIKRRHPHLMSKLHEMKVNALLEKRDRVMKQRMQRSPTLFQNNFKRKATTPMDLNDTNSNSNSVQLTLSDEMVEENVKLPTPSTASVSSTSNRFILADMQNRNFDAGRSNEHFSIPIDLTTGHSKLRNEQKEHADSNGATYNDHDMTLKDSLNKINVTLIRIQNEMSVRNQIVSNRILFDMAAFKHLHPNFVFDM